jgi:hypothetical protein
LNAPKKTLGRSENRVSLFGHGRILSGDYVLRSLKSVTQKCNPVLTFRHFQDFSWNIPPQLPKSPVEAGAYEEIALVPCGFTQLRISVFPFGRTKE